MFRLNNASYVHFFFVLSIPIGESRIISWNRFDAQNFMTNEWLYQLDSQYSVISSRVYLKFNLNITQIPIKMVWTEVSQVRFGISVSDINFFDCFHSVAVQNWKYIEFVHICCKLKPSISKTKTKQKKNGDTSLL